MSLPSTRNDISLELAPHTLSTNMFNAQGSACSCRLPPSTTPVTFDSVKYPAVDGQFLGFYKTPREVTGASGSMGIYGGYRETQSFDEGQSPAPATNLPPVGRPFPPQQRLGYYGCPFPK